MENKIFAVVVPFEKKIKVKGTKCVEVEDKIYLGYVFVDMIVYDNSWYVVRNILCVMGFVGTDTTPVPLTQQKINFLFSRMNTSEVEHDISITVGELVSIVDEPFKDFEGK